MKISALPAAVLWGLLLICTFVSFSPALTAGFLPEWDDNSHIVQNPGIFSLSAAETARTFRSMVNLTYIPLTTLSYALEFHFFGLNPFVVHLNNLLLHLIVVGLVGLLGRRLGLSPLQAFLAGAVFALHPMHVESVAWATGRKDMLYSIFYLLALVQYARYVQNQDYKAYAISGACALLSILSKPMALSLPWVLWLIDWHCRRPRSSAMLVDKIPFALLVFPVAWQTYASFARAPMDVGPENALTILWCAVFYLNKFFLPVGLYPVYPLPGGHFAPAVAAALLWLVAVVRLRHKPWIVWALAFYASCVFFLWRFDTGSDLCLVADRYMYLPSAGLCLMLGFYGGKLWEHVRLRHQRWMPVVIAAMAGLAIAMAWLSFRQSQIWRDSMTLWNYTRAGQPDNPVVFRQLGILHIVTGRYSQAIEPLSRMIALQPDQAEGYNARGVAYLMAGQNDAAAADFTTAISLQPNFARARENLKKVLGNNP